MDKPDPPNGTDAEASNDLMNRQDDLLDEIRAWLLAQLPTGEYAVRVLDLNPLAESDDPAEWHDVLFCVDTADGRRWLQTVQVHGEWIDDAPASGGPSYVINAMKSQGVVGLLLRDLDHRTADPIVLRHPGRG